jgi:hypothetical protein
MIDIPYSILFYPFITYSCEPHYFSSAPNHGKRLTIPVLLPSEILRTVRVLVLSNVRGLMEVYRFVAVLLFVPVKYKYNITEVM